MNTSQPLRKLLICLSYYDGDSDRASDVLRLITDLESSRCNVADILLYRRFDAKPLEDSVKQHLLSRFNKVHELKCRRLNCTGYPAGPNAMFFDLIEVLRGKDWTRDYYAFLNLESDCVPTKPGWINAIIREYTEASINGFLAVGHINEEPVRHLNGVAVYSTELFNKAGGFNLLGGPENVAYDFYLAPRILPVAVDTPLILLDFNRKTITSEDLFGARKAGQMPVIYHGVKDLSAITAVRSRFIDRGRTQKDVSHTTIMTYVPRMPEEGTEDRNVLELWKHTWLSQGFNPVVCTEYDARKHTQYTALKGTLDAYKATGKIDASVMKWLALDYIGGGLLSDMDTVPALGFTPDDVYRDSGLIVYQSRLDGTKEKAVPSLLLADRSAIQIIIDTVLTFDFGTKHAANVADEIIANSPIKLKSIVANIGTEAKDCKAWSFCPAAVANYSPGSPRSTVMKRFTESYAP